MHSRAYQRNSEPQPSLCTNRRIALAGEMLSTRSQVATQVLADQETSIPAPVPATGDRGDLRYPLGRVPISELDSSTIAIEKRLTRSQVATRARAGQANCQQHQYHRNAIEAISGRHKGACRLCNRHPTTAGSGQRKMLSNR